MSKLSQRELYKYDWRVDLFLKMLKEESPFELINGMIAVLQRDETVEDLLANRMSLRGVKLKTVNGHEIYFSDIRKTADFGGKGKGSSVVKEDRALKQLSDQIENAKGDKEYIDLILNNSDYIRVSGVESTPGTPKSDFHLIDENRNPVLWISHKDGKTAKDFQQWGGISERKEPVIFNHPETQKFIADLKEKYPEGLPKATAVYRKIVDSQLKHLAVYGNQFGFTNGPQNVTILAQGSIGIEPISQSGKYYTLSADQIHYNGEEMIDEYEPVLMAIYKGDRSDAGVKGTRIVISPIGGRRSIEF